jgi:hypothetical protein
MADKIDDILDGHPLSERSDTKLCRSSRGVHVAGSRPAAAVTRRQERRTSAALSSMESS